RDPKSGFIAIIAVHSNVAGGLLWVGCRIRPYESLADALHDVLRLAEGMTYKNSLAGLNLGGGKAVIIADRDFSDGRSTLFESFGDFVESLGGRYITAEDMGTTVADIEAIHSRTEFVTGRDPSQGGGGNPSPYTARGVYDGLLACLERKFGTPNPSGKKVAIQGVGAVGLVLARLLRESGAQLILSDSRGDRLAGYASELDAKVVPLDEIYSAEVDVFSPCAIGGILNEKTIPKLRCSVVAGAANNQLASFEDERLLAERGIIYAPDFAINSGGVILCADEVEPGGFSASRVEERVSQIGPTVARVLEVAAKEGKLAGEVALALAKDRIAQHRS
ncbi:UNVERIFIED_CONTAM: hypothetical protein GTU68_030344, partial [Idotea baltica]|nr:hypothetical protein [Idotea baltica]